MGIGLSVLMIILIIITIVISMMGAAALGGMGVAAGGAVGELDRQVPMQPGDGASYLATADHLPLFEKPGLGGVAVLDGRQQVHRRCLAPLIPGA